ncbi:DUF4265 domain-containing protein [Pseudomonas fulva]|uniref:DUF4265 domain-containing protein n=1 Tax=Pseudomonas TaxID=286 RepID=UPI00244B5ACB|nr:DUF4265 domain-containing protein [Pseudomonas fulva]MDH1308727.1 DUF4265 domain-containing protein [Pseudomonas fulva]
MNSVYKKVLFPLQQDANGYPPASVEGLWAKAVEDGYVIDNIPFHVYGIAPGDVICTHEEAGQHWFARLLRSSGSSVFRVRVKPPETLEQVSEALVEFGCTCESEPAVKMLAIAIPPARTLDTLLYYLITQREAGFLDFEEGVLRHCVAHEFRQE